MSADAAVEEMLGSAGRLRILTALAAGGRQEFVRLRGRTQLTDGNLATHTRRLEAAGLVAIEKTFFERKPVTHLSLTEVGRAALQRHANDVLAALGMLEGAAEHAESAVAALAAVESATSSDDVDDWID